MWVSKKKWQALEKRVADLEGQVHGQLDVKIDADAIRRNFRKIRDVAADTTIGIATEVRKKGTNLY